MSREEILNPEFSPLLTGEGSRGEVLAKSMIKELIPPPPSFTLRMGRFYQTKFVLR
jgi:hypothetical protein